MKRKLKKIKNISGYIPESWKTVKLDKVINQFIVPMRDKPKELNGEIPWCRIEDFDGKYLKVSKSKQGVSRKIIEEMNLKVYPINTVLVSCSANLGKCAITKKELVTNQTFIGLVPLINKVNEEYLYYLMGFNERKLNMLSSGTTISYLSRNEFEKFWILLPPLPEQKKIAEILSTWDKAISTTEELIEKLTLRKKGLMQQLLTGKTRLKGFSGKWESVRLADICKFFSGGTPASSNSSFYNGTIPFIRSGEINSIKTNLSLSDVGLKNSSAKMVYKGDLLYALYGATSGEVGISKISGAINQAVLCIRSEENISFLYYVLLNLKKSIISTYLQGGQGNLSANIIKNIQINIPPLIEQNAIAEVLTAVDKEIKLYEEYLSQLQTQKKGLMQKLLTGEIRVEVDEVNK